MNPLGRWIAGRGAATAAALVALVALVASANAAPSAFESEIRAFESADAASQPARDVALFVGSSSFTQWTRLAADFPGFTVLNRGFGGSQFSDVLHFFDRVVAAYNPSLIVIYEGDNDLASGRSIGQVFGDWTNFVGRVERELPDTGVLFVSVKPSPSRLANLEAQQALNARIADDCATRPGCGFVDAAGPMLDENGEPRPELFLADRLHMNESGYALWRQAIGPELEAWAAAHPERSIRAPLGRALVDFGSPDLSSDATGTAPGVNHWNNITGSLGASSQGRLSNLVTAEGATTTAAWVMTSRFNGVNLNGTTAPAPFPASATRDSMFGNTEVFSGLANVTPAFRITGLRPGVSHDLTFYASRTGVGDIRETRYTVTGDSSAFADLDAANNVSGTARVVGIQPDADGALSIALSPGPRNNNANHFTYLGTMVLEEATSSGRVFLFDVGGADSLTGDGPIQGVSRWNDVPTAVGTDPSGTSADWVATDGTPTPIALRIVAPFRTADVSGTGASTVFPASATRDSLLGHGAVWNGMEPATPAFRLTGLDSNLVYTLGFHASALDPDAQRETRYVVDDGSPLAREALLNASGNTNGVAWMTGVIPDDSGTVEVRLLPGPANDSEGRIVHLGVLALEWRTLELPTPPTLRLLGVWNGLLRLRVDTAKGRICRLESSLDLISWVEDSLVRPGEAGMELSWSTRDPRTFFRLVDVAGVADSGRRDVEPAAFEQGFDLRVAAEERSE